MYNDDVSSIYIVHLKTAIGQPKCFTVQCKNNKTIKTLQVKKSMLYDITFNITIYITDGLHRFIIMTREKLNVNCSINLIKRTKSHRRSSKEEKWVKLKQTAVTVCFCAVNNTLLTGTL